MGRRNSDDSPTLKKVLSTGRDGHELRYGVESSCYFSGIEIWWLISLYMVISFMLSLLLDSDGRFNQI